MERKIVKHLGGPFPSHFSDFVQSWIPLGQMQADTEGRAFDLTGQVTNVGGSQVWASYRMGPALLEFDLASRKIRTLIQGPSGAYAISVVEHDSDGKLLTGGADGMFVCGT